MVTRMCKMYKCIMCTHKILCLFLKQVVYVPSIFPSKFIHVLCVLRQAGSIYMCLNCYSDVSVETLANQCD